MSPTVKVFPPLQVRVDDALSPATHALALSGCDSRKATSSFGAQTPLSPLPPYRAVVDPPGPVVDEALLGAGEGAMPAVVKGKGPTVSAGSTSTSSPSLFDPSAHAPAPMAITTTSAPT